MRDCSRLRRMAGAGRGFGGLGFGGALEVSDGVAASLETDLNVDGILVARKGSDVYGRLASADQGGKCSGKSELQLELTRLMTDGRDYSLVSSDYNLQGKSRGSDSAKKVGGG